MSDLTKSTKNATNSSAKFLFWVIGLAAVIIIGFIFLSNHSKQSSTTAQKQNVAIDYSNEPYLGKSSAPVSLIEFGDYKCPNCKIFNKTVIPVIQQQLIDTGQAKLYFMNDSFIYTDSTRAAKFAESVYEVLGNNTFWKFHDLLYKNQPDGSKYEQMDVYSEKFLVNLLKQVANPTDVNQVVKNFEAKKSDAAWQKDMDLADKLNVDGTPTIFVDGKVFNGTTVDDLKNMVNEAAKAKGK